MLAASRLSGKDAAAYAVINAAGQVTNVVVTSPGFGYDSHTTISFIDGFGGKIYVFCAMYSFSMSF